MIAKNRRDYGEEAWTPPERANRGNFLEDTPRVGGASADGSGREGQEPKRSCRGFLAGQCAVDPQGGLEIIKKNAAQLLARLLTRRGETRNPEAIALIDELISEVQGEIDRLDREIKNNN